MSYVVFALKWRPKNFQEVVGQEHIVTTLSSAIEKKRLAHAYLFAGPRGVGKTSTARILAKALNCSEGPTAKPCGKCPACVSISEGRSLDVIEIDGASNRGIDEIRTLRENVKFAPAQGRYKVYIIDEVHQITPDGFNALLKTLEEPPEFVKFVFATTQPNKVIPTILSRCQRLDFRRISVMEIAAQLERIAASEEVPIEKEALLAIARSSDGALRDAESILDQLIAFTKGKVTAADVTSMLGLMELDTLFAIAEKIAHKDARGAVSLFSEIIDQGKEVNVFLSALIEHFRNLMIAKVAQADPKLLDLPQEACAKLLEQAKAFSLEEIFTAFNTLVGAQEMGKRLDSGRIPAELALIKLAHDKREAGPAPAAARPGQERPGTPPPQALHPKIEKPAPPAQGQRSQDGPAAPKQDEQQAPQGSSVALEAVSDSWQDITESLGRVKMSVATYLSEGQPVKLERNILTVSFPMNYSLHKETLEERENRIIIERVLSEMFNSALRVNFVLSKDIPVKEDIREHPFVKSVLKTFDGRVIKEE